MSRSKIVTMLLTVQTIFVAMALALLLQPGPSTVGLVLGAASLVIIIPVRSLMK
jgi:hypothetical protein